MSAVPTFLPQQFSKTKPFGPVPCEVMIVGEAPGSQEEIRGIPFVGQSGSEFNKMAVESGLLKTESRSNPETFWKARDEQLFLTNVCKYRPPENKIEHFFFDKTKTKPNELILEGIRELHEEIRYVQPKLILAMGDTALWAFTKKHGITKWRGSMLEHEYTGRDGERKLALLMPTYHPALILREWSWRSIALFDMRRAREALERGHWPERRTKFIVRPAFSQVMDTLNFLQKEAETHATPSSPLLLADDLETRGGYIACHGIAWSALEAICIPNLCVEKPTGYFTLDQDVAIWEAERRLLTDPRVAVIGQNYLYDAQYKARRRGYVPNLRHDTMAMQHLAWPGLPKTLDFMSSMYCQHHVYWKDEGKEWSPKIPEDNLWIYNCDDTSRDYEIFIALRDSLQRMGKWPLYEFQMRLWRAALNMMLRGVTIDQLSRGKIAGDLLQAMESRRQRLAGILGYDLDINSPKKVHNLFYDQLGCAKILNRKTKRPTCDEDALKVFVHREPLLKPITDMIVDLRALGAMMSNVIQAPLDADGKLRSELNPYQAETFRWVSRKNAFGGGTNLQNWTKGDEDKEAAAVTHTFPVPNVRKLIIPEPGFEIASIDLTGADAQTVAWESGDEDLKRVFRENKIKIHAHNAKSMFRGKAITGYEQPYYDLSRTGVHLVNYVGGVDTLAAAMGISHSEAQAFMDEWFGLHPKILQWHENIQEQLETTRRVNNKFGYTRFYFDRISGLLPEAIAWIGQSTTSCVTNRAIVALEESSELKEMDFSMLFQVHDELVLHYPTFYRTPVLRLVHKLAHITVPYDDPLVIPWGLKLSKKSWGDCEKPDEEFMRTVWPSVTSPTG